jgi:hypothetical protein
MREIRIQAPFFTQLRKQQLKKGPKIVFQRAVKLQVTVCMCGCVFILDMYMYVYILFVNVICTFLSYFF